MNTLNLNRKRDLGLLAGRWALPSGRTFTIYWTPAQPDVVWCGSDGRRWKLPRADIEALLSAGQLRYLGRK